MLHSIGEYGKFVEITGFKNVKFSQAEVFLKTHRKIATSTLDLQFFDADLIATASHLEFAVLNALQAFQNCTNISKSLAIETMLYASALRQIQKAIGRCGIKPQTSRMAAIILGNNSGEIQTLLGEVCKCVGSEPDETVLELSEDKLRKIKEVFKIEEEEIEAVMNGENRDGAVVGLVIERMALLATQL